MVIISKKQNDALNCLYDKLATLDPGTEEYDKVLDEITKLKEVDKDNKDRIIKIATFAVGLIVPTVVDLLCKRNLAKYIGTIEQMETFTSSAGRSISGWFKWK